MPDCSDRFIMSHPKFCLQSVYANPFYFLLRHSLCDLHLHAPPHCKRNTYRFLYFNCTEHSYPAAAVQVDQGVVDTLLTAGFSENACRRAAHNTHGQGAEPAMEWLLMHMEDPDLNDPLPNQQQSGSAQVSGLL